ncbi:hypothetical protein EDB92DRAFT_1812202 [Lactarius akahatsu]|uniref:Protein kinase domain-containing protein n=1 Tax=Lactarius akahatsu TaxID=416441 RepID=A0AAD4LT27_9AGAM|nr:hypothetical protein EDB92DRAFT_1812202 [Lactarius akahatsu]
MNDDSNVRLLCVVVDDNLKVRDSSFTIMVSSEEVFGGIIARIIGCVVEFTPSLQASLLSIIDFGLSIFAESEDTLVEGYRGTPSRVAPEVGREHGPMEIYSAVLADRWSCAKVLKYFADFLPIGASALAFEPICARLLSSDSSERPPLSVVLQIIRGASAQKHGSEAREATVARKRHRIMW